MSCFSEAIAAVAEEVGGSEALALRLALRVTMLAAQQNRETLDGNADGSPVSVDSRDPSVI